ncbi:cAMP-binding domain of CRP or a regulatory subunit of cAMP-dependent protein kinases [Mucilaginibacter pineti]|uniref:cAMP-binding domain of CRP or a regulatory subunit of cAMP-dependent protein kinases n=1 Tax=Mucilaginibacter pineti TaxID=1391627 RepID=A0A1G7H390_9SPHI|nr:cyclic nucleotide-binding domain-containing protein [Mucilaginibacter pineti]SDE94764.1 cAMP-binding domain of CRP or a regulatory subunit of cAMP-dependent protein kinases [Mucilaginibacter pineti]
MIRKHHISAASYQQIFDYLASFQVIEDPDFHPQFIGILSGYWCNEGEEKLHQEREVCAKAWFITKGMIYLYFTDVDKGEVVLTLFRSGELAIIPDSFMNGKPATCNMMACADTEVLEISKAGRKLIHQLFPQSLALENAILAQIPEKGREREALLCLDAEERLTRFFELYPELHPYHKTVKMLDKHIASYLHIDKSHYSKYKNQQYPKKAWKSWHMPFFKVTTRCTLAL